MLDLPLEYLLEDVRQTEVRTLSLEYLLEDVRQTEVRTLSGLA